jgi:hypothetical protein
MDKKTLHRKPAKLAGKSSVKSDKAVQQQFTMLPSDVELINNLRGKYQREAGRRKAPYVEIAKSEVIRAGIHVLKKMSLGELYTAIENIEVLKEGRPKKESA